VLYPLSYGGSVLLGTSEPYPSRVRAEKLVQGRPIAADTLGR
jgi:hypothetical protein